MAKKFADLFAFDLDGTLVHRNETGGRGIPQRLLEAVNALSQKAHTIIATGRRYRTALEDLKKLPYMKFAIVHNGLVIRDPLGNVLERSVMETSEAIEVAKNLAEHREDFFFVADGYKDQSDYIFTREALEKHKTLQMIYGRAKDHCQLIESIDDLANLKHPALLEVGLLGSYSDLLEIQTHLQKSLPNDLRALVVKNIGFEGLGAMEIFKKEHSKWSGVHWVQRHLGATRVITVGDDENDIEMLQYADIGVAMGHAEPHVLSAAKRRVADANGLAEFLEEFYLK